MQPTAVQSHDQADLGVDDSGRSPPSPSAASRARAPTADEPRARYRAQADLGPDLRSTLDVLRPLLPTATAEAIEPLLRASRDRLRTRYSEAKWEVAFSASPVA